MALADPQSITVSGSAKSMPRISSTGTSANYSNSDSTFRLNVSHTDAKDRRIRSMAQFIQKAIVADPLTAENDYQELKFYVVIDRPEFGFTSAQVDAHIAGFKTWLDTTMIGKLFGKES